MKRHNHINISDKDILLQKRRCFFSEEDSTSEEAVEELHTLDSRVKIRDLINDISNITDSDVFVEKYGEFLEEEDLEKILEEKKIDEFKPKVLEKLMKRAIKLKMYGNTEALEQFKRGNEENIGKNDIIEIAQKKLKKISKSIKGNDESEYYEALADALKDSGLSKRMITKTNDIKNEVNLLSVKVKAVELRRDRIKAQIEHLDKTIETAKERATWVNKLRTYAGTALFGVASGLATYIATPIALQKLAVSTISIAIIGSTWLHRGIGLGFGLAGFGLAEKIDDRFSAKSIRALRHKVSAKDFESIKLQSNLLDKGSVRVKKGTNLKDFMLPQGMELKIQKDGKNIKKWYPAGYTFEESETLMESVTMKLPYKKDKLEEWEKTERQKTAAEEELKNHNEEIKKMSIVFKEHYERLKKDITRHEDTIKELEENKSSIYLQLASAGGKEKTTTIKTRLEDLGKAIKEANSALERAKKAKKALDQVASVYSLNKQFAKKPVTGKVLEELYKSGIDPSVVDLIKKYNDNEETTRKDKELTEKSKDALNKIRGIVKVKDKGLTSEITGLVSNDKTSIKSFLKKIDIYRGHSDKLAIRIFPFLEELKKKCPNIVDYLLSILALAPGTKYSFLESKTPEKYLLGKLEEKKK